MWNVLAANMKLSTHVLHVYVNLSSWSFWDRVNEKLYERERERDLS